ncbi:GntR family transcriptional regulator [Mangrovicella endophytica]|uniref:GntR family transcriptional regulator n=1 Tax=Mangrovicella endophytica TaxID=2066697 RepID=UPI000C9E289B|nr:GntR family transcriptional regulator [Mangrovicella endophytica]
MSLARQFNTRPLYQQVADEFISRIVTGTWVPGQPIENEADIARSLGISLGTARKAFDILVDLKLLDRQQGKGTVVSDPEFGRAGHRFSNICDRPGRRISGEITIIDPRIETPSPRTAELLEINVRTPILAFGRIRSHEGRVFMTEAVQFRVDSSVHAMTPAELEAVARRRWVGSDLAVRKRETVTVGTCDAEAAATLKISEGTPVLRLQRVILSYQERPLEVRDAVCYLGDNLHYAC